MQNKLDKHTQEVKTRIDANYLSPLFIRYANMLYMNDNFEECIAACKTGLDIFPDYLTAKLILLKALLKAEYLNEAELLYNEIKDKISNRDLMSKLGNNILNIKAVSKQEKIYYPRSGKAKYDYKSFEKSFHIQGSLFSNMSLEDFFKSEPEKYVYNEKDFENFTNHFSSFHFERTESSAAPAPNIKRPDPEHSESSDLLGKIKIITETLADIYAKQGNYKEAFEAYKILIRAGSKNSNRIEDKLYALERSMLKYDNI